MLACLVLSSYRPTAGLPKVLSAERKKLAQSSYHGRFLTPVTDCTLLPTPTLVFGIVSAIFVFVFVSRWLRAASLDDAVPFFDISAPKLASLSAASFPLTTVCDLTCRMLTSIVSSDHALVGVSCMPFVAGRGYQPQPLALPLPLLGIVLPVAVLIVFSEKRGQVVM